MRPTWCLGEGWFGEGPVLEEDEGDCRGLLAVSAEEWVVVTVPRAERVAVTVTVMT